MQQPLRRVATQGQCYTLLCCSMTCAARGTTACSPAHPLMEGDSSTFLVPCTKSNTALTTSARMLPSR